jgi:hypothetical protein
VERAAGEMAQRHGNLTVGIGVAVGQEGCMCNRILEGARCWSLDSNDTRQFGTLNGDSQVHKVLEYPELPVGN